MKNSREIILERIDCFETVKQVVLSESPRISDYIQSGSKADWKNRTNEELKLSLTMAYLKWDIRNGSLCRKARTMMRDATSIYLQSKNGHVSEKNQDYDEKLTEKQLLELGKNIAKISQEFIQNILKNIASTLQAKEIIESNFTLLRGLKSFEFLENINYPVVIPDQGRTRWLERMGFLEQDQDSKSKRENCVRVQEEFAHQAGVSLSEFSLVTGAFAGSLGEDFKTSAFCIRTPKCPECALKDKCPTFRFTKTEKKRDHQSLQSKIRRTERPREKLEEKGAKSLSEEELIAILLRTGSGKLNALELSQQLLRDMENLSRLSQLNVTELSKYHGLGRVKAITLIAAFELASRLKMESMSSIKPVFNSSRRVFQYFQNRFMQSRKEEFITLLLNTKLELIREVQISLGTLNQSLVHPREVFHDAIKESAYSVIFVHNHPSGDPAPSRDDIKITDRLVKAGDILQIKVNDHIIIGRSSYYSFKDEDRL